jgi:acetyltransferase-like isoleucine patch superfamily enzyme
MARPSFRELITDAPAVARAHWHFRHAEMSGHRVRIWGTPKITAAGRLIIGDRTRFASTLAPVELVADRDGVLDIGAGTFINFGCNIAATKRITIGPNCNVGPYCMLLDNAFHHVQPERRQIRPESRPIVIGENVWLGARVIVLPGVSIGKGSVVGAGSVVTRDLPDRVFAAGVPARIIRSI